MEALKLATKPNVYSYHDYLRFLRDHFDFLKNSPSKLSLRSIAQASGISPALLAMSLSGKRRMTERVFAKLISTLEFNRTERTVLKLLRTIAETEVPLERTEALEELQKIPEYRKLNNNSTQVFQYLSNWVHVAIREMLFLPEFKEDVDWIKSRIRGGPSSKEIQASLEFLKDNGYAEYDSSGRLVNKERHLDCSEGVFKISLGEFHRQMFSLASDSIEEVERDLRLIMGHSFTTNLKQLNEVKNILSETIKKLENISKGEDMTHAPTEVYHLEIALFPLTQPEEGVSYE